MHKIVLFLVFSFVIEATYHSLNIACPVFLIFSFPLSSPPFWFILLTRPPDNRSCDAAGNPLQTLRAHAAEEISPHKDRPVKQGNGLGDTMRSKPQEAATETQKVGGPAGAALVLTSARS